MGRARVAAVAENTRRDRAAQIIAVVAAAVNVDLHIGDKIVWANVGKDTGGHIGAFQLYVGTVDALGNVDGHSVVFVFHLYLAEDAAYVVGAVGHLVYTAIVAAAVQVGRRTGNRIIEVARHAANSTGA